MENARKGANWVWPPGTPRGKRLSQCQDKLKNADTKKAAKAAIFLIGARGETRTLTIVHRWILNPLRLPFRHPGYRQIVIAISCEKRIMP